MTLILSGTDGLSDVDGSAATPALRGTDANTGIFFPAADTIGFAEGGAEVARFDSSGNLGIGTSSPATRLEVRRGDTDGKVASFFQSAGYGFDFYSSQSVANVSSAYLQAFTFSTNAGSGQVERMRIDSSGNLLVGTTSGSSNTISSGNGYALYVAQTTTNNSVMRLDGAYSSGTTNLIAFYAASTYRGAIQFNGSSVLYTTASDYRLKENIAPMTGALATVAQLKPVTYKWKSDGADGQGFIAHELQAVVPDCVTGEKDAVDAEGNPQYQGIDTSFLVATLTAAIQEQQALITQLQADVASLKGTTP